MVKVISAVGIDKVEYIYVSSSKSVIFVSSLYEATKFTEFCDEYIDVILEFLRKNFEDYHFRALSVNSLLFNMETDGRIFDRENFNLEVFRD